jgi:hypothetical protein
VFAALDYYPRDSGFNENALASGEKAMTLKDAQDKAAEKRADIKRGIDPAVVKKAAPVERSASTVKAVAEKYFEEYCARKQRERTQEEVKRAFKLYVFPMIGEYDITQVTKRDIKGLVKSVRDAGFDKHPGRGFDTHSNRVLAYTRAFFNWVVD